ncbi:MAG: ABC transporter permease [Myxococcales bacterium]
MSITSVRERASPEQRPQDPQPTPVPVRSAALEGAAQLGALTIEVAEHVGGIFMLWFELCKRFFVFDFPRHEILRHLFSMANGSLSVVAFTSLFNGAILVLQAAPVVTRFGASAIIGWAAGFGVLNELSPLLVGLMFSGRVGANNTAELGTMVVTEQVDGLRALAIDPLSYLILPRVIAMTIALVALNIIGAFVALIGAILCSSLLLDVGYQGFMSSFLELLNHWDFLNGFFKSLVFGVGIALTSSHYGLRTRGGAPGVGRAVNASVVAAAIGIFVLDYLAALLSK